MQSIEMDIKSSAKVNSYIVNSVSYLITCELCPSTSYSTPTGWTYQYTGSNVNVYYVHYVWYI